MQGTLPPESSSNPAAYEGTAAHQLAQTALTTGKAVQEFPELLVEGSMFRFPDDTIRYVQDYVDHILELADAPGAKLYVEQNVRLLPAYLAKDTILEGTLDACIVRGTVMQVLDLKFGRGVEVGVKENPQIMIYALAMLDRLNTEGRGITDVMMTIYQPRMAGIPYINSEISAADLRKWGTDVLLPATKKIKMKNPKFNPTVEACRFCRYKSKCEAHSAMFYAKLELAKKPLDTMTDEERVELFRAWPGIKKTMETIEQQLHDSLKSGKTISGVKLTEKSLHRKWDPRKRDLLYQKYGDEVMETKLLSPAQVAKKIGSENVSDFLLEREAEHKVCLEESKSRTYVPTSSADVFTG